MFLTVSCFVLFFSAQKKKASAASLDPDVKVEVGDQVLVAGQKQGTVRFYGKTDFAPGLRLMIPLTLEDMTFQRILGLQKREMLF